MKQPHKWRDVIIAYANGEQIQYRDSSFDNSDWFETDSPDFDSDDLIFRVIPETPKDKAEKQAWDFFWSMRKGVPFNEEGSRPDLVIGYNKGYLDALGELGTTSNNPSSFAKNNQSSSSS